MATIGDNYDAAIRRLQDAYGSDLALQEAIWKELYNLSPVKPGLANYEQVTDVLAGKVETLRGCGTPEPALDQFAFQWLQSQPSELTGELLRLRIADKTADQPWKMAPLLTALKALLPLYRPRQSKGQQNKSNEGNKSHGGNNASGKPGNKGNGKQLSDSITLAVPAAKAPSSPSPPAQPARASRTKGGATEKPSHKPGRSSSPDPPTASPPPTRPTNLRRLYCRICRTEGHRPGTQDCRAPDSAALYELVKKEKRCVGCLASNHLLKDCDSRYNCFYCQEKHHSRLHTAMTKPEPNSKTVSFPSALQAVCLDTGESGAAAKVVQESSSSVVLTLPLLDTPKICMLTFTGLLTGPQDHQSNVSCFLDSGATHNYIRKDIVEKLQLKTIAQKTYIPVPFGSGNASQCANPSQARTYPWVQVNLEGPNGNKLTLGAFVVDSICADFVNRMPELDDYDYAYCQDYQVRNLNSGTERVRLGLLIGQLDYNSIVYAYEENMVPLSGNLRILLTSMGNFLCGSKTPSAQARIQNTGNKPSNNVYSWTWKREVPFSETSPDEKKCKVPAQSVSTSSEPTLLAPEPTLEEMEPSLIKADFGPPPESHNTAEYLLNRLFAAHAAGIEEETVKQTEDSRNKADMDQFLASLRITDSGRYECGFLWKTPQPDLPNNLLRAYARLNQIVRKLKMDGKTEQLLTIDAIFKDYMARDMLETVDADFRISSKAISAKAPNHTSLLYYISHFPVFKETAVTTKCRVVLDGSEKVGPQCRSLNDHLHKGENLMCTLAGVLMRSRLPPLLLLSDCEKAYLSVGLRECDRDSCRILWLRDPTLPYTENNLVVYRFKIIVFGIICSAFILHATFGVLLDNAKDKKTAETVKNAYYVDNFAIGASSIDEAKNLYTSIRSTFGEKGFNMRCWASNSPEFNSFLPNDTCHPDLGKKDVDMLGLVWDLNRDEYYAKAHKGTLSLPLTKRKVAVVVGKLGYDALGLNLAAIMQSRLFLGELWKAGYDWDEPLSEEETNKFQLIFNDLLSLSNIKWPRRILPSLTDDSDVRLIAFTDASEVGIAACVYIWTQVGGQTQSHLLASKAKITSAKASRTIVQLELNAAIMGTRLLLSSVEELTSLKFTNLHLFSDSTFLLCFLKAKRSCQSTSVVVLPRSNVLVFSCITFPDHKTPLIGLPEGHQQRISTHLFGDMGRRCF